MSVLNNKKLKLQSDTQPIKSPKREGKTAIEWFSLGLLIIPAGVIIAFLLQSLLILL